MPSLCTKPQENGATPPDTTLQAALAIVEKKVRNLEKRKGKLDAYRDTLQRGKPLNEDQQAAVAKYDEVIGTLEFARELSGQFTKLALDEAKDKKKMMKKEQQERAKVELIKVNYVLSVREVLSALLEEGVLEDLEGGNNGAPKLSADQLSQLQQFQELATPNREDLSKGSFDKQVAASAEHLVNLAEKKTRAVVGTTYQEVAQLIDMIRESGYIEAKWANDSSANTENGADDVTQDTVEDEEEELVVEETSDLKEDETSVEIKESQTNGHFGSVEEEEAKANMLGQTIAAASEPQADPLPVFPNPPQVAEVVQPVPAPLPPVPEPSFNFLQESQIDLESPHMDPAVVMVHPPKRTAVPVHQGVPPGIPSQTFTNQLFQQSLAGLTPAQQQALLAQQQAIIAQQQAAAAAAQQQQAAAQQQQQAAANSSQQDYQNLLQQRQAAEKRSSEKFASSYNSAFDPPQSQPAQKVAPGVANGPPGQQPAPFTQNGPSAAQEQRQAGTEQQQPAFSGQPVAMEQRADAPVDPRAPRVPEGTPQHAEQPKSSPSPQSRPAGYAAAAGGNKQPDTEIGTWKPEGIQDWNEEEEDNRWGGDKGRGRGRGGGGRGFGRGNRGYSRGRGDRGGDRGHRGGDRGRNDRKYDDRREDRRDDRKYDDRGDRPRGGYRGRGENGGRGGYRGRGGAEGGRGGPRGGGQNGYRD